MAFSPSKILENSRQVRLLLIYSLVSVIFFATNHPMFFHGEQGMSKRMGIDIKSGDTPLPWWLVAIIISVAIEKVLKYD